MTRILLCWFKEGLFVFDAPEKYQEIINLQPDTINDGLIAEILDVFRPVILRPPSDKVPFHV